jgi:hypothetical protein
VSTTETYQDGVARSWSYNPSPGNSAPIDGLEGASVIQKRIDDRTVQQTWKFGTLTMEGRGVLSKDGKTMMYTLTGTTRTGKPLRNVELFEKQ